MSASKRPRTDVGSRSVEKKKVDEKAGISVSEFYAREDCKAMSLEMSSIEELFLEHSKALRQQITHLCTLPAKSSEATRVQEAVLSRFISLRRLNRFAQYRNRQIRDQVNLQRSLVEERFLQLQNVNSEIEHLNKEIDRCYDFKSADVDIQLVSVEEFYANAPPSISQEEITRNDPHKQRLARLNWELTERKSLVGTIQELEGRKNVLISDITTKEHRLKSLVPKIEAIIEAASSVRELMGLSSAPLDASKRHLLSLLPQELSVIAVQIQAYCDIVENPGVVLNCNGDSESAIKFMENQQELLLKVSEESGCKERSSNADDDLLASGDRKRRRSSISEQIIKRKEAMLAPHPNYLEIVIKCQDDVSITLILRYVPGLHAIGVSAKLSRHEDTFSTIFISLLSESTLLMDLYPDDDGSKCPNVTGQIKLNLLRMSVKDLEPSIGKMFIFAQEMAGLNEKSADSLQLCEVIHDVIKRIRARIHCRFALARSAQKMHALKLFEEMSTEERSKYPSKVCSKLTDFRMINAEQFLSSSLLTVLYRSLIFSNGESDSDSHFYFSATIERSPGTKLNVLIYIDVAYPKVPPIFILRLTLNKIDYSAQDFEMLKHLEESLNVNFMRFLDQEDLSKLMELQVAFLISRFDILIQCQSTIVNSGNFVKEHLCPNFARGRNHQLPLCFNSAANAFSFHSKV